MLLPGLLGGHSRAAQTALQNDVLPVDAYVLKNSHILCKYFLYWWLGWVTAEISKKFKCAQFSTVIGQLSPVRVPSLVLLWDYDPHVVNK